MTIKLTAAAVERDLPTKMNGLKEAAAQVKESYKAAHKAIMDDPMTSDLAKRGKADMLLVEARDELKSLRANQDAYTNGLKSTLEKQVRGDQPADANAVLLRRDAADRVRKINDPREALEVLNDALANDDHTLANAIGIRGLNQVWEDVADAWKAAYPDTADSAAALAYVEANTSGAAYNLANQITYSDPTA